MAITDGTVTNPYPDCNGTGVNAKKTAEMKKRESSATGHVRCWNCNGNGIDPLAHFRFTEKKNERSLQ